MKTAAPKFATFDLEIASELAEGGKLRDAMPVGITCAALAFSDAPEPTFFHGAPQMSRAACAELVRELQRVLADGYTLVTWNGTAFDFAILADEADMPRECAEIALAHVDLMAIVTFLRGHWLGLQKALLGAGIAGKKKEVLLNDGTRLYEMTGARAPQLWAQGEYNAVLSYLREDVMPLLELTRIVYESKQIRWTSNQGRPNAVRVPQLYTVRECFQLPEPNTSWMQDPKSRAQFVEWMPPLQDFLPPDPYAKRDLRELPLFAYSADAPYWREFRHALKA